MKLAMQQSQEIARARQAIESMLGGKVEAPVLKEVKSAVEKPRPSPTKSKLDLKTHFSEPPAPPPQAPLPEKPDVARALADPMIQPLLRRSDTARPPSANSSPTRGDHSSDILRLCEELKLAKGELSDQSERMKHLEQELQRERSARESAEERAHRLEQGEKRDAPADDAPVTEEPIPTSNTQDSAPELQIQIDKLRSTMDEMKQQMEAYRQRAEKAETERDEAHQTLAELIEQKRKEHIAEAESTQLESEPSHSLAKRALQLDSSFEHANGHAAVLASSTSPTTRSLFQRAGVEEGQPITPEQAKMLTRFLTQEVLHSDPKTQLAYDPENALAYYGVPYGSFAAVVVLGYIAMTWINGWPKTDR
jgi:hypothetical protein